MRHSISISFRKLPIIALSGMLLLIACNGKKEKVTDTNQQKNPVDKIVMAPAPDFNADSAYAFIEKQVAFGPRIPGTASHEKCAAWLTAKLKSYTPHVIVQDVKVEIYNGTMVPCKNIIASFNPEISKRILLCAHWDTRPWSDRDQVNKKAAFDGADDGGSGVGVLLEVARHMSKQNAAVGIDIVFFDVEDYGPPAWEESGGEERPVQYCLGSQYWAENPHVANYRAYYGILLDMVGARDATFPQEGISLQYAPTIVKKVWSTAHTLGFGQYFLNESVGAVTDDHAFINSINGTPCIDIIHMDKTSPNSGFARHWHTQQDNMSVIDKATLKAVGQTLLQVLANEAPAA